MDNKIKNDELSNLLIAGDSHMQMVNILFKKGKLWNLNLNILKKKINFVTIKGTSILGILKKRSKTNIRKKMDEKLKKNKKIDTIFFALGFNDLHSIFPYKKIKDKNLTIDNFIDELLVKYEIFLKSYGKKYKILVQSIMPLLSMKKMELYELYLKRYDLGNLKQENKKFIFNNYDKILNNFNKKLKEICIKNNFYFFNNNKIHDIFKKYDKYILSSKQVVYEFHYMPFYYLIILIYNIGEYFTNFNSNEADLILKDMKKYLKNDKEFSNFSNKLIKLKKKPKRNHIKKKQIF